MKTQLPTITAICHVRAPLLLEPVDRQVETLRACKSEGTIDDLLLRSWPKEVRLGDETPYHEVLEAYDRFRSWADHQGVEIQPPFTERTTTSQVTGKTKELLVTPLLCLELYVDDELAAVYPHSTGDETITTDDAIATLRSGDLPRTLTGTIAVDTPRTPSTDSRSDACPDCDGALVNGQGLFTCTDCEWTGIVADTGKYVATTVRSTPVRDGSRLAQTQ